MEREPITIQDKPEARREVMRRDIFVNKIIQSVRGEIEEAIEVMWGTENGKDKTQSILPGIMPFISLYSFPDA